MVKKNYLERLSAYYPLSGGLSAYLETIVKTEVYIKGHRLHLSEKNGFFYPLIASGAVKLIALSPQNDEEVVLAFYFENNFIYHFSEIPFDTNYQLMIECLEDTSLLTISELHYSNILKLFPEAYKLNLTFCSSHLGSLLNHLYIRNHYKAKERYFKMLEQQPEIGKRITIMDMGTFLGLDQTTISRIRATK